MTWCFYFYLFYLYIYREREREREKRVKKFPLKTQDLKLMWVPIQFNSISTENPGWFDFEQEEALESPLGSAAVHHFGGFVSCLQWRMS